MFLENKSFFVHLSFFGWFQLFCFVLAKLAEIFMCLFCIGNLTEMKHLSDISGTDIDN